eukprot:gene12732-17073_t
MNQISQNNISESNNNEYNQQYRKELTSIEKEIISAKKNAFQAIGYGITTIEHLDNQEETLRSVEDTLESNEYILNKSMKTMQNMTWSGYLYNKCASVKKIVTNKPIDAEMNIIASKNRKNINNSNNDSNHIKNKYNNNQLFENNYDNQYEKSDTVTEDDEIIEISRAVSTLQQLGTLMTEKLDNQLTSLDRIEDKTDRVNDKTLAVTLKASQLTQRSRKKESEFIGSFQFLDCESGRMLAVFAESIVLTSACTDRSTFFNCFVKENNIIGIQNQKTLKFIGCSLFGSSVCSANAFNKQEETFIELNGQETGIFLCARNWGGGGWIKHTFNRRNAHNNNNNNNNNNGDLFEYEVLNDTTNGISDKSGMVKLKAFPISHDSRNS